MKPYSHTKRQEDESVKEWGLFSHILPRTVAVMIGAGIIVYLIILLGQALNVSL